MHVMMIPSTNIILTTVNQFHFLLDCVLISFPQISLIKSIRTQMRLKKTNPLTAGLKRNWPTTQMPSCRTRKWKSSPIWSAFSGATNWIGRCWRK